MRIFPQDYSWSSTEQQDPLALNPTAHDFYPQGTSDVSDRHHLLHGADEEQDDNTAADMRELDDADDKDYIGDPGECVDSDNEMLEETEQSAGYPKRERRPQTLTYDKLGQPSFTQRIVSTREIAVNSYWRPW
ncbi:unnamed protein product [Merluccius merluccius]